VASFLRLGDGKVSSFKLRGEAEPTHSKEQMSAAPAGGCLINGFFLDNESKRAIVGATVANDRERESALQSRVCLAVHTSASSLYSSGGRRRR